MRASDAAAEEALNTYARNGLTLHGLRARATAGRVFTSARTDSAALADIARFQDRFQDNHLRTVMESLRGAINDGRERLEQAQAAYPGLIRLCAEAHQYRWMLEEFRVSLFAQQMKTRLPVSNKRLEQQWQLVQTWIYQHPR